MARPKTENPKNKKALRLRDTDLERYHEAMKKLGESSFNAFVEKACNELTERVLQGSPRRETPEGEVNAVNDSEERLSAMEAKLSAVVRSLDRLRKAVEKKEPAGAR